MRLIPNTRWLAVVLLTVLCGAAAVGGGSATAQEGAASAVDGRIVAQRLADGRTEFGWLPTGGDRVLPRSRYFPSDAEVGRWLNSSPIEINGAAIGRINARLLDDGRIEFAFTPTDADRILPRVRRFPATAVVNRWLRSSVIRVLPPPASSPPRIDSISCLPASPGVDQEVTCTANVSGGEPQTYLWSGGASGSSESTYTTNFISGSSRTISLTVANATGHDSLSVAVGLGQPPACTGALTLHEGSMSIVLQTFSSISVTVSCADPDGHAQNLILTSSSADASIASIELYRDGVYEIKGAGKGQTTVSVTATDQSGLTDSVSFSVTVLSSPPVMQSVAPLAVEAGGSEEVTLLSWDPDGERFTVLATVERSGHR